MSIPMEWCAAAVAIAQGEWATGVKDAPAYHDVIARYHKVAGADWTLEGGEKYQPSEDFWCGVFVAYCFARVGDALFEDRCVDLSIRRDMAGLMFTSTTRLANRGPENWSDFDVPAPKIVDPAEVRPGDIPVVRTGRTDRTWGDHVTLARGGMDRRERIPTYEGNAKGDRGGDLGFGEGVVRSNVTVQDVSVIYRLRKAHFTGESLK